MSIAERWASRNDRNAGWRQEYPYCGPEGGRQPKSPDYVGWTWDTKRRVFWSVPGTFVIPAAVCPGITASWGDDPPKYLFNHLMTFDPFEPDLTQRWQDRGRDIGPTAVDTWMSVYDAGTDSLIRFGWDGARGAMVNIYDITAGQWTAKLLGLNAVGQDIRIFKEMLAADWGQRVIYVIDGIAGRLHRYRVDGRTIEDLGVVPGGPIAYAANNDAYAVWDSLHRVLFFFRMDTSILHVYHPDTQEWETPPLVTDPPGLTPHVRHAAVFDPYQNVLVLLGTTDTANPYMYLYRYAEEGRPSTRLSLSGIQFHAGQTLNLGLSVHNPNENSPLELYVGAVLPDGKTLVLFSGPGVLERTGSLSALASLSPMQVVPPGFQLDAPSFFQYTFPPAGVTASGVYRVFSALIRPASLDDNAVDPDDIVALSVVELSFAP